MTTTVPTDISVKGLGRIYLAGPMTGYKDFNHEAFEKATKFLRALGYLVVSPHEHCDPILEEDELSYARVLARDMVLLAECKTILFLPNSQDSKGANVERVFAEATSKQCILYVTLLHALKR
jgi:nucleoside 2-deoxyribosyltransferase